MTTKTYAVLNANALGPGLLLDASNLQVTTGIICDGKRMVLGDLAQASGESSYENYFWSTLRNSLAGLASFGVAQLDTDIANFVGGDAAGKSWGFRPADGQVWNANANVSGTSVPVQAERMCLGLYLYLSPSVCTCTWTVNGSPVYTATLPNGKQWAPAISLGSTVAGDVSATVNFGQSRGDQSVFTQGWWQQAPGLATLYLALATEAFLSAAADTPANTSFGPFLLNANQVSIKRAPQAWFHRGGGKTNPAALTAIRLDNSRGTFNALIGADVRDSSVVLQVIDAPAGGTDMLPRRNLLIQTEDFTAAAWIKSNMTTLAGGLRPTANNGYVQSSGSPQVVGQPLTVSFEYLPTGLDNITIWLGGFGANRSGVQLAIVAGTIGNYTSGTGIAPTNQLVADVGLGWRRVVFTALAQGALESLGFCNLSPSTNANGINGIRIRKLQVETGSIATAYQRVTTATDYATTLTAATSMFTGIVDTTSMPDASTVTLSLRDSLARFDKPCPVRIVPPFYDAASAGKIRPIGLGAQRNVLPLLLDAPTRLYALGDAPMSNVTLVSDNAAPLDPNALPPQYNAALNGEGLTLQTDVVGRLAVDCSSVGAQYAIPGASDVLNGDGKFFVWPSGGPLPDITTVPPDHFTWSNGAGSTLIKQVRPGDPTAFLARITSIIRWSAAGGTNGDYLTSTTTPLLGGRSYRITFKLPAVISASTSNSGDTPGGIMIRSALGGNPADAISPHGVPVSHAIPYSDSYSYDFSVPAGANRNIYIMGVASRVNGVNVAGGGDICNVNLELLGQYLQLPLQGITLKNAFTEILVVRGGEDPSVFSAADCDAIDSIYAATHAPTDQVQGYPIGLRWEDQPNMLDMLSAVADQFGAVIFTDALGVIRVRRLTDSNDGSVVVAAFSAANIEVASFSALSDTAPGLTTNYGSRHNWTPFAANDFVTDTATVPAGIRAQYQGTSQFNVSASTPLAQEYAAARGAGRLHTWIDDTPTVLREGNRVSSLFSTKHLFRQFVARYDGLTLGIGPSVSPEQLYYNDKITIDLPAFGWVGERMTVVGTELFPSDNRILITVRH